MSAIDPRPRYDAPLRWMHWSMFVLVLLAYLFINVFTLFPRGSALRANILASHFLAGLAVLLLVLPRVWLRRRLARPPIVPPLAHGVDVLGKITHAALYAFLLVQPLLGVATLQVGGKPVALFGVTLLPAFVSPPDRALSKQLEHLHGTIGTVFYWVIGLHILVALWHHYGRRDNALQRML